MNAELQRIIRATPQQPQRQDATIEQLRDLRVMANRLGMYDAADYLRIALERQQQAIIEIKRREALWAQHNTERRT